MIFFFCEFQIKSQKMRIGENRRRQLLSHCETMAPTIIAYLVRLFSFLSVIHISPIESIYSILSSSFSSPFFTHSLRFPIPLLLTLRPPPRSQRLSCLPTQVRPPPPNLFISAENHKDVER